MKTKLPRNILFLYIMLLPTPLYAIDKSLDYKAAITAPIEVDLQISSYTEKEFIPQIDQDIYTWSENTWQLRSRFLFYNSYFSIAWEENTIEQKNKLFNDLDFSIDSRGPVFGITIPTGANISSSAEINIAKYKDASKNAFYTLTNSNSSSNDLFYSGFLQTTFSGLENWTTFSYNRSRDTEPLYDPLTNRAELNIRAKELTGISTGWLFSPEWELTGSIFFEKYETGTADQFNINNGLTYRPHRTKQLELSIGSGYYTEEEEIIVNLSGSYDLKWRLFDLSLLYQLEYSDNEHSLLHEGRTTLKYYLNKTTSFTIAGDYGEKTGGDKDSVSSITASLNFVF